MQHETILFEILPTNINVTAHVLFKYIIAAEIIFPSPGKMKFVQILRTGKIRWQDIVQ